MCQGEGACGPAAQPGHSPWPCRAEQGRAGPHLTHLLGPLQRDPRRPSSALHLPCARVRTGWSPREGCMEWPHDWVQQASLGDHEGRAGLLWPSVLCSHTAFWDPRLGGELEVKTPAPLWSQTATAAGPTPAPLTTCQCWWSAWSFPAAAPGRGTCTQKHPPQAQQFLGLHRAQQMCAARHRPPAFPGPGTVDGRTADTTAPVRLRLSAQHRVTAAVTGQLLCASGQHWVLSGAYYLPCDRWA